MQDSPLVISLAQILADANVGLWTPGVAYPAGSTGIFYGQIGTTPNRAIGLTLYDTRDDLSGISGPRRVQARYRGEPDAPTDADDLAQEVFDVFQGLMRVSGIHLIRRLSSAQLGIDGSRRRERADNYEIIPDLEA